MTQQHRLREEWRPQARADRDADLTHLVMRGAFPADKVAAAVFRSLASPWRVEP